jgi:hypothetical protein
MKHKSWAICATCDKWNETPPEFHELKHFCWCKSCGGKMFLLHSNPQTAGYSDKYKTEIKLQKIK